MRYWRIALIFAFIAVFRAPGLGAHCQVPCGIYGDEARIAVIKEDAETIEKAFGEIRRLEKEKEVDYNQIVRWINTKEEHADDIMNVVSSYFLAQRIKPADEKDSMAYGEYTRKLELLHNIMVYAMKTKQSLDAGNIRMLRKKLGEFEDLYFKD
ncbi:MAG: superoxide dismutase [Elusimicrobia bacterium]|nr:superoxide dismutase [Elusimicrobiota bacterium]